MIDSVIGSVLVVGGHFPLCYFLGTIGSIPLKDPNFRYIPWTPHVIDSCGPTCK
jgi:hypothetical protein